MKYTRQDQTYRETQHSSDQLTKQRKASSAKLLEYKLLKVMHTCTIYMLNSINMNKA